MSFVLGTRSRSRLKGVHPDLVRVVELAIELTAQDFSVHSGVRTLREQEDLVAGGTSWTLNSKHLKQPDGFGHAVDLVPYIGGRLIWDWDGCFAVACAMAEAARVLSVELRWGGAWDRNLGEYGQTIASVRLACETYVRRRRTTGKRAAIDGPHFELLLHRSDKAGG